MLLCPLARGHLFIYFIMGREEERGLGYGMSREWNGKRDINAKRNATGHGKCIP